MKIEIPTKNSIQAMFDNSLRKQSNEFYRIINNLKDRVLDLEIKEEKRKNETNKMSSMQKDKRF